MTGHSYPVLSSREVHTGRVVSLRLDRVRMPDGAEADREVVRHPGAVAVAAIDDADRIALILQYRHPVGRRLWELPAGLLDVPGEPAVRAAQRELHEETHLAAGRWDTLIDLLASPGFTDEALRVFLAREVTVATAARHVAEGEELELAVEWVPLDDAAGRVFAGEIVNAAAVAGILAAARCRDRQWLGLRPADAPWADRPRSAGRVDRPTSA